ncbi:GntR family transcriptional regulator [Amycolatopsis sp. NPDC047767]|uniref:GntR family transcriptional regulator n=1 Tax=Amycolatopsis sp. NPDC047767 TaxID=3156765 RepID=UPI003454EB4B
MARSSGASRGGDGATAPERVAALMRDELFDGAYPVGTRLREELLADRFDVGRHTVRAALRLLAERGLVVHERNRGAVVPALTQQRIDEIFDFRTVLEVGALRMALANGADLSPMRHAVEKLEGLAAQADPPSWRELTEAHGDIHEAIVRAANNSHLLTSYGRCQDEVRVLLTVIRPEFNASRLALLHRQLLDKVMVGGDVAIQALVDDLELAGRAALVSALRRAETDAARIFGI